MSVSDVLKKAAAKKSTKPSTDMVEITVPPGMLAKHKELHDVAKSAKADAELSEEELLNLVKPKYEEHLKERYVNSARIQDGEVEATISWKDSYKKIPVEKVDDIKEIVGDKYGEYFKEVNEIVVKEDVASNEKLLEELIQAVGPDTFAKFFDVAQHIKPTTRFTEERRKQLSEEQNRQLDVTVQQYKPAVRLK